MPLTIKPPPGTPGKAWPAIVVGLFVAFGGTSSSIILIIILICLNSFTNQPPAGVLYGYDTGTIGGILANRFWLDHFSTGYINPKDGLPGITSAQSSEIVSILSAGTFFGALTAAPTADFFGRRVGLMISCVVFTFGVILQTIATAIPMFVAGRFFAGFGVGMISAQIPLYQSETAPKWIRGTIVGAYQLAITIGLLLAAVVNNSTKDSTDTGSYRIPVAVQFAWALILFAGLCVLPETPRMQIKRGRPEDAAKSLAQLRRLDVDHPSLVEELSEITANHEYELSLGKASYIDCFRGNLGKRLATGCLLQALQQLTGVNFIFYYGTSVSVMRCGIPDECRAD
jgi:sugar porter (SP) family MFS transporter